MTYLNYFQFDNEPFSNLEEPKYKFRIGSQCAVLEKAINSTLQTYSTTYIYGKEGVGKTFIARELASILSITKNVVMFNNKSSQNLKYKLENAIKKATIGKRTVLIIDDYQDLINTEKRYIKEISNSTALQDNKFNIIIISKIPVDFAHKSQIKIDNYFKISSMNLFESFEYVTYMLKKTKSINSNKRGFRKWIIMFICLVSNGRVKFVNTLAGEAIKNAYRKKRHRASVRGLLGYFSKDSHILRTNISERFKQICILMTSVFILFEVGIIVQDKLRTQSFFTNKQEIEEDIAREKLQLEKAKEENELQAETTYEQQLALKNQKKNSDDVVTNSLIAGAMKKSDAIAVNDEKVEKNKLKNNMIENNKKVLKAQEKADKITKAGIAKEKEIADKQKKLDVVASKKLAKKQKKISDDLAKKQKQIYESAAKKLAAQNYAAEEKSKSLEMEKTNKPVAVEKSKTTKNVVKKPTVSSADSKKPVVKKDKKIAISQVKKSPVVKEKIVAKKPADSSVKKPVDSGKKPLYSVATVEKPKVVEAVEVVRKRTAAEIKADNDAMKNVYNNDPMDQ